jgi:hypothetical protein
VFESVLSTQTTMANKRQVKNADSRRLSIADNFIIAII